jgi:hypothetical protein
MPPLDDELKARIYSLPTRNEFENMLSQFVTREVFNLEIKNLRDELNEIKARPANSRALFVWAITIVALCVGVLSFLVQHIVLR